MSGNNPCGLNAVCTNTPGSYTCACSSGFVMNQASQLCEDYNECLAGTHNCHEDAICTNIPGAYQCQCSPGYVGDGLECSWSTRCTDTTCLNGGTCVDDGPQADAARCVCPPLYTGDDCVAHVCETCNGASPCYLPAPDNVCQDWVTGTFVCPAGAVSCSEPPAVESCACPAGTSGPCHGPLGDCTAASAAGSTACPASYVYCGVASLPAMQVDGDALLLNLELDGLTASDLEGASARDALLSAVADLLNTPVGDLQLVSIADLVRDNGNAAVAVGILYMGGTESDAQTAANAAADGTLSAVLGKNGFTNVAVGDMTGEVQAARGEELASAEVAAIGNAVRNAQLPQAGGAGQTVLTGAVALLIALCIAGPCCCCVAVCCMCRRRGKIAPSKPSRTPCCWACLPCLGARDTWCGRCCADGCFHGCCNGCGGCCYWRSWRSLPCASCCHVCCFCCGCCVAPSVLIAARRARRRRQRAGGSHGGDSDDSSSYDSDDDNTFEYGDLDPVAGDDGTSTMGGSVGGYSGAGSAAPAGAGEENVVDFANLPGVRRGRNRIAPLPPLKSPATTRRPSWVDTESGNSPGTLASRQGFSWQDPNQPSGDPRIGVVAPLRTANASEVQPVSQNSEGGARVGDGFVDFGFSG